jgi:hypothetical protein
VLVDEDGKKLFARTLHDARHKWMLCRIFRTGGGLGTKNRRPAANLSGDVG